MYYIDVYRIKRKQEKDNSIKANVQKAFSLNSPRRSATRHLLYTYTRAHSYATSQDM